MLYLIGLGLGDERDITLKGLESGKRCDELYLEVYTSLMANAGALTNILSCPTLTAVSDLSPRHPSMALHLLLKEYILKLEHLFERPIRLVDRDMMESHADRYLLEPALTKSIGVLVVGDPLSATTHTDLILRALHKKIPFQIVHNASIINAVGCTGLQLYRFGQIVSIVFFTESWRPDSFYDRIQENRRLGLHTLCLLDIQMTEKTIEALLKDLPVYQPPRFMLIPQALEELLEVETCRKQGVCTADTWTVGVARLGSDTQQIVYGRMEDLKKVDWGHPLHSLVIPGHVHPLEQEFLDFYAYKP